MFWITYRSYLHLFLQYICPKGSWKLWRWDLWKRPGGVLFMKLSFLFSFPKSRGNIEDLLDNTVSVTGEQILAGSSKYLWPLFSLMFTSRWMNFIFRQIQGVMLLSTPYKNFSRAPSFFLQFLHSQLSETFTVKVQSNFCFLSWEFLMCKQ